MSIACGVPILECVYCLGCARWVWLKCLYTAGYESENWGLATAEEFEPIPRLCRLILAVYEDDLRNPLWAPPGGYGIDPDFVILRKNYEETQGQVPPYMVYLDHENADIVLAIRGLNLAKESDYAVLLDNKLGQTKFDGGYVHNGLLKAAVRVFDEEWEGLRELAEIHPTYTLTLTGHSLGAGVVALLTIVALQNLEKLGTIVRKRIRCYAIAPARCMSLNLAVRYADVINSVVLQDDFLPRTTTALEDVFRSLFCLPCLLCLMCLKDTCTLEKKRLKDPRRLYAPGRLYHIVERKPFRMGRFPPVVRTAVPVDGRFEHLVLSCNATTDHAIIWIERESQRALDLMLEEYRTMEIPEKQRMERQEFLVREHSEEYKAALQRAVALDIPHAISSSPYGTFHENEEGENSSRSAGEMSMLSFNKLRASWDGFIERLFDVDESGHIAFKRDHPVNSH
uniref:Calmodulin-binding heat-shock protein n=1 Tax=Cannabis sativa TaxID=3483 RepID=A0A803NXH3_CANSA